MADSDELIGIPGSPIAYWTSTALRNVFKIAEKAGDYAEFKHGMSTGKNDAVLRMWPEVSFDKIAFFSETEEAFRKSGKRFVPYNKGGEVRKWYGNQEYVLGYDEKYDKLMDSFSGHRHDNRQTYFKENISWSKVSSTGLALRYFPQGFVYDVAGCSAFVKEPYIRYILAFFNGKVKDVTVAAMSPTMNFEVGQLRNAPIIIDESKRSLIESIAGDSIEKSKNDWDSFETSWDFEKHPLVLLHKDRDNAETTRFAKSRMEKFGSISWHFDKWSEECLTRFNELKLKEEELNRIFIDIYGLQGELTPEVDDKDVTVRLADKERDIRSLISYLVGVAMGRYSLDTPGLAYAGGEWDASKYVSYQPDDDGIIPIYNGIGMEDGLTTVLINLIKQIYGEDTYRQNIDFIAEALGKNNNESSEETLNRYLNDGFYADHLKVYQKRPIYWLFTSGKKAGFKCLIYMHRYNSDTLARINAKYFLPESTRMKNELEELNGKVAHSEGREKLKYEKERQNLVAAYNEAIEYGQVLDHMANRYISIDLDDGVKENYAKFQGIEIVTDGGSKVKKDLLAPLK